MKKSLSILLAITMLLILAPMKADATVSMNQKFDCTTKTDPSDSTRKITDCNIVLNVDQAGEMDGSSAKFTVTYNYKTDKSDFEIIEETNGVRIGDIVKTDDGGSFDYEFSKGLSGSFTAFKIRFYADAKLSGKDCGGTLSMNYNGKTSTATTSTNTDTTNPKTGVSVPVVVLGAGILACLAVYASTSKKTKMHRI